MLIYVNPGGNGVNIRAFSRINVGMLTLYTMRKITKGTLPTSRLISVRESTENSQTGRIIFVVLCRHCDKDPMRDIWQFYFAFFTQRIDQLYDTVISMFVQKKKVLEDLQSLHIKTRVILA